MNVEALHAYFAQVASTPTRLGHVDCVSFVAEALLVGFGRDYCESLRYNDRKTAVARLRGADGLRDACSEVLGDEQWPDDLVAGDVAYFETPHATIGLVMGDWVAVKYKQTILKVDRMAIMTGWRS